MKKLLVSCLLACMFCLPAFAQENQNKEKDKQQEYAEWQQKVKQELNLTEDQVSKWNALDAEYKGKMNAAKEASLDKDAQKAKMMELRKEKHAKFLEILSADQQSKYNELIEKKKKDAAAASKPAGS